LDNKEKEEKSKEEIIKEVKGLLIVLLVIFIFLKIGFYKDSFLNILIISLGLFWSYILPGYSILAIFKDKVAFVERIFVGFAFSLVLVGVPSYYLGLIGFSLHNQVYLLPGAVIVIGILIRYYRRDKR